MRRLLLIAIVLTVCAGRAPARTFLTQQQALDLAFPAGTAVSREMIFLTRAQSKVAEALAGIALRDQMIIRYVGRKAGVLVGTAYFDTHVVRTLPETLMALVTPEGTIDHVEILSFSEPTDYLPKPRWMDQLKRRKLDDDLSVSRSIRPISGASLSGRAVVNATRRVLAIHRTIEATRAK